MSIQIARNDETSASWELFKFKKTLIRNVFNLQWVANDGSLARFNKRGPAIRNLFLGRSKHHCLWKIELNFYDSIIRPWDKLIVGFHFQSDLSLKILETLRTQDLELQKFDEKEFGSCLRRCSMICPLKLAVAKEINPAQFRFPRVLCRWWAKAASVM